MSRGNAFKFSANMALGGGSDYGNTDINDIKNSLKLLKGKKNQRQMVDEQMNNYGYGASSIPSLKNYGAPKNEYNYEALFKNHMPSSSKEMSLGYGMGNYGNDYSSHKGYNNSINSRQSYQKNEQPYSYSNKPPSYSQENATRNNRIIKSVQQPPNYEPYPNYGNKNAGGRNSNLTTKVSEPNSYSSKQQPIQQQHQTQIQRMIYEESKHYNQKEERSIKQINRQNQINIKQYDPSSLRPCRVCGRKFNPDSIKKHEANCNKVFQKKRKQFNAQQKRIIDAQQKKLMKKGQAIEKKIEIQQKNQKIPKWKAQSLAFRAILKQNRNVQINPKEAAMIQQIQNQAGVKCPYCGRKFNDTAGPRHIKFCEEQAKKNQIKKKK